MLSQINTLRDWIQSFLISESTRLRSSRKYRRTVTWYTVKPFAKYQKASRSCSRRSFMIERKMSYGAYRQGNCNRQVLVSIWASIRLRSQEIHIRYRWNWLRNQSYSLKKMEPSNLPTKVGKISTFCVKRLTFSWRERFYKIANRSRSTQEMSSLHRGANTITKMVW